MSNFLGLDVGDKRIGVAVANDIFKLASPRDCIFVDGSEIDNILQLIDSENVATIVVGWPRNMSGEETMQTKKVKDFSDKLAEKTDLKVQYQDESLTSVEAERRLKESGKEIKPGDIDSEAATIILQDYLGGAI